MHTSDLVIRPFDKATDLKPLSDVWFDASLRAHPFLGRARLTEQRRLIEDRYLPLADTTVACLFDRPVGFISLLDSFIGGLFVAPARQGQGIGCALIARTKSRKAELSLEVYTANEAAMRFYAAQGFGEVSRRGHDDQGLPHENAHMVWAG
ncbi:putative N-acetyltransferase YjaB (plasmid) [Sulfitobacter sp. THAF37]|uniref:GNAT family N-acetyltransferase n=1 Tax=Sulfitobacter sp. THAF37 TaxID=2587855 RepID=UPI001268D1B9|nr:GNAT family N-acetyltransferase [Sulfitobacter sp. THAF37]QFT61138.1 putative N-acetyltransferase YjaB [Sulfitobacter sp. THAF37]